MEDSINRLGAGDKQFGQFRAATYVPYEIARCKIQPNHLSHSQSLTRDTVASHSQPLTI